VGQRALSPAIARIPIAPGVQWTAPLAEEGLKSPFKRPPILTTLAVQTYIDIRIERQFRSHPMGAVRRMRRQAMPEIRTIALTDIAVAKHRLRTLRA